MNYMELPLFVMIYSCHSVSNFVESLTDQTNELFKLGTIVGCIQISLTNMITMYCDLLNSNLS